MAGGEARSGAADARHYEAIVEPVGDERLPRRGLVRARAEEHALGPRGEQPAPELEPPGDIPLDDVLAKREQINHLLQARMDEVTQRWGVKITTVEIREITPPKEVQDSAPPRRQRMHTRARNFLIQTMPDW